MNVDVFIKTHLVVYQFLARESEIKYSQKKGANEGAQLEHHLMMF